MRTSLSFDWMHCASTGMASRTKLSSAYVHKGEGVGVGEGEGVGVGVGVGGTRQSVVQ